MLRRKIPNKKKQAGKKTFVRPQENDENSIMR